MINTNYNDIVLAIIEKHWEGEVEDVGKRTVTEIIDGNIVFEGVSSGEQLPFGTVIADLTAAIAFVKSIVDLVILVKRSRGHQPSAAEVEKQANDRNLELKNASVDKKRVVINSVLDCLSSRQTPN